MKKKISEVNPTRIDESLLGIKRFGETVTPLRLGSAAATDFLREESAIVSDASTPYDEDDLESRFPEDEDDRRH